MKKISFITFIAIVALLLVAMLNSCNKQEDFLAGNEPQEIKKDFTIFNKINSFAKKMCFYKDNPEYKDGESVDLNEAIWLMEGAINLTYGFPFDEYGEFTTGNAEIIIQKNLDGDVDMDEISVKYQLLIDEARNDYYNSGFEDKGLYIVNLELDEENDSEATVSVEIITGNKGIDPWPFEEGDDWWYGEDGGGCNGNTQAGIDAAHELAGMYPAFDLNEYMAIADPKIYIAKGGDDWLRRPNDTLDNTWDYYIFCVQENVTPFNYDELLCLLSNEMAVYYVYLDYVVNELAPIELNVPENHIFIDFNNWATKGAFDVNQGFVKYYHYFELLYALPYDKPYNSLPIEL